MRWFRVQGRASAWVALAALLIQFAVSFGHIHLDHAHSAPPAVSDAAKADPHGAPDEDRADQACAICILNQMVGSVQTAAPPAVLLTLVSHAAEHTFVSERIAAEPPSAAFRSRAPPSA